MKRQALGTTAQCKQIMENMRIVTAGQVKDIGTFLEALNEAGDLLKVGHA
jgi:hypothetical protein